MQKPNPVPVAPVPDPVVPAPGSVTVKIDPATLLMFLQGRTLYVLLDHWRKPYWTVS